MSKDNSRIFTIVVELDDAQTIEKLMEVWKTSIYVEGCRVIDIWNGNIPEALSECEHNYSELLSESNTF